MIDFRLSVDVLGNTRFAYSPMAEVASSVRLLGAPQIAHLHQPWLREVRERLTGLDMELLCAVAPPGRWAPDFLYLPSPSPLTTVEDQLRTLSAVSPDHIREELVAVHQGRALPRAAEDMISDGPSGLARLTEVIWDYWQTAIQPYWTRMCGVLEDDVSYRASKTLAGGLFDLLTDLHPEVNVSGDLLSIDKPHHTSATYTGAALTLIPSVFVFPNLIVSHARTGKFELTYAARGVGRVWEGLAGERSQEDPLGALLGRTRAAIMAKLAIPMSTTQLARELGQSPGTISQHLSILRGSGMVTSWRSGRSVLYRQTPLAASIVAATRPDGTAQRYA